MPSKIIEIEANTLEEARVIALAQIPNGFFVYSESVVSDATPKTVQTIRESLEEAEREAEWKVPRQANVLQHRNEVVAESRVVDVVAYTEKAIQEREAEWSIMGGWKIESVQLHKRGSSFLGFPREKNTYRVTLVSERHRVEIIYQEKAKIRLTLDKEWTDELKLDFLRTFLPDPDSSFSTSSYSHFDAKYREWCERHDKRSDNKSGGYSFYGVLDDLIYDDAHGDDAWNVFRLTENGKAFLMAGGPS